MRGFAVELTTLDSASGLDSTAGLDHGGDSPLLGTVDDLRPQPASARFEPSARIWVCPSCDVADEGPLV